MKFLCSGDNIAYLKEVVCDEGTDTSKKDGIQPSSIRKICDDDRFVGAKVESINQCKEKYLIVCRKGGIITLYDKLSDDYGQVHEYTLPVELDDHLVSLVVIEDLDIIIAAYESANLYFMSLSGDKFATDPVNAKLPGDKSINAFVENPDTPGVFAFGGKDNNLKIVQLFDSNFSSATLAESLTTCISPKVIFTAKNVKNDHLDLQAPIWITKILFVENLEKDGFKIITTTKYGQLRIFDTTHGRRPIYDFKVSDRPLIGLAFADEEHENVIVSDSHNIIAKYSLIKIDANGEHINSASAGSIVKPTPKLLGKYSSGGNSGAILAIDVIEDEIVSLGGLDRYLKVYDVESREIVAKVYIGVEVTGIIILEGTEENTQKTVPILKKKRKVVSPEKELEEDNEIWQQLDENSKADGAKVKKPKIERKKRIVT
ncbi:Piso0_005230 [Millerozyma farinosa CBS 7064]|uniref:Ribosome biogenesis protein NSA1 n=1 Tax=Pichia sorbitophila (strain ATCC MYA-4447 / BCRC 22081 / CBS 7064 / NBRC 10061 / NRRL Y-12695) TaxID=559304 RepID=G8Y4J8_PICSO|nr:Piso0_005230 [Millerozyma farinosa CBS 7064]